MLLLDVVRTTPSYNFLLEENELVVLAKLLGWHVAGRGRERTVLSDIYQQLQTAYVGEHGKDSYDDLTVLKTEQKYESIMLTDYPSWQSTP